MYIKVSHTSKHFRFCPNPFHTRFFPSVTRTGSFDNYYAFITETPPHEINLLLVQTLLYSTSFVDAELKAQQMDYQKYQYFGISYPVWKVILC